MSCPITSTSSPIEVNVMNLLLPVDKTASSTPTRSFPFFAKRVKESSIYIKKGKSKHNLLMVSEMS